MFLKVLLACGVIAAVSAWRGDFDSLDLRKLAMKCPVLSCMKQCLHGTLLDDQGCGTCICKRYPMDIGSGLPVQLPSQQNGVPLTQPVGPLGQPVGLLGQPVGLLGQPLMSSLGLQSVCSAPIQVGPCLGSIPSWGYDSRVGKCVQFIYGGCQGNRNRFATQQLCDQSCSMSITSIQKQKMPTIAIGNMKNFITAYLGDSSRCEDPISVGTCGGNIPSWGFHAPSGRCVKFIYGGCQGNRNRFLTLEGCNKMCQPSGPLSNPMIQGSGMGGGQLVKPGVCPAPSGLASICLFDPKVNCLSDEHCPGDQKCCSGGCGLFCKNPLMTQSTQLNANTFRVAIQN